jgi:hypothetical protein
MANVQRALEKNGFYCVKARHAFAIVVSTRLECLSLEDNIIYLNTTRTSSMTSKDLHKMLCEVTIDEIVVNPAGKIIYELNI